MTGLYFHFLFYTDGCNRKSEGLQLGKKSSLFSILHGERKSVLRKCQFIDELQSCLIGPQIFKALPAFA